MQQPYSKLQPSEIQYPEAIKALLFPQYQQSILDSGFPDEKMRGKLEENCILLLGTLGESLKDLKQNPFLPLNDVENGLIDKIADIFEKIRIFIKIAHANDITSKITIAIKHFPALISVLTELRQNEENKQLLKGNFPQGVNPSIKALIQTQLLVFAEIIEQNPNYALHLIFGVGNYVYNRINKHERNKERIKECNDTQFPNGVRPDKRIELAPPHEIVARMITSYIRTYRQHLVYDTLYSHQEKTPYSMSHGEFKQCMAKICGDVLNGKAPPPPVRMSLPPAASDTAAAPVAEEPGNAMEPKPSSASSVGLK